MAKKMADMTMIPLDAPQPRYDVPDLSGIQDTEEDKPLPGKTLASLDSGFSHLVFGGGALSGQYQTEDQINSSEPFRAVRLAFRYGITSIDTSAYYGQSEIILGSILRALEPEFPRSSYKLITKCGRYGLQSFDYTPSSVRKSVMRSLERLGTKYIDVLFLHDVEFVAEPVYPQDPTGDSTRIIDDDAMREAWGLHETRSHGEGDDRIIAAYSELRHMRSEGLVRAIGITGYPLPTLLRLSRLLSHTFSEPLDALLSYSHHTLSSPTAFSSFVPLFFHPTLLVQQLFCASPLNMGFFGNNVPSWSPAPKGMMNARNEAFKLIAEKGWDGGMANLALGYGFRRKTRLASKKGNDGEDGVLLSKEIPTVIGFSTPSEVHEAIRVWWEVNGDIFSEAHESAKSKVTRRMELERDVKEVFRKGGWLNWSWASPPLAS